MLRAQSLAEEAAAPVTRPQLRECFGCGKFQIVPALGPDMRSDCVRCDTSLRRTRRDPLNPCLALTAAALALSAVVLLTMAAGWADTVLVADAVWEEIERRGQTHSPMPAVPSLDSHPNAIGCEACGLVGVAAGPDTSPPRCGSALQARKPDRVNRTWAF